ncbi:MAG TPA: dephospho-CoA kinase [Solirubrobacteraceae bacterium]
MGAGKSTALAALERLGAATISADAVVHELYGSDEVRDAVTQRWGPEVAPDGTVDRAAVARRAFAAPDERAWLEGLLWPLVGARVAQWRAALDDADPRPRANSRRRRKRRGRRTWSQTAEPSSSWSLRWPQSLRS